ncbi:DUF3592 domain-containing protein [Inquilinus limosus]|uniref:DUF3592 domain-containing protein n=1 Tax=Inquilinus limosus TaxID=171674 RepID=A0A211ZRX4_9PROT|nr:DUF3592 domain-containing protein [Inquilinus limosus]OWJ67944.1 hypothetical protein BWR60_06985 [Inquilinus limosus]
MARVTGVRALPILGLVFFCLGLAGLIAAGALAWREMDSSRTATADGVIVDFNNGPVVEFTTAQGTVAQFRSPVRSTTFVRGQHLPVAYDPADPSDAAVDGFAGRWFLPSLFGLIFGVFLVIGLALSLLGRVLRPRQPA